MRTSLRWGLAIGALTLVATSASCSSADTDGRLWQSYEAGSFSLPPEDAESSAPPMGDQYRAQAATFCVAVDTAHQQLFAMADANAASYAVADFVAVEQQYHDDFAALLNAHDAEFGETEHLGVEPLSSGLALDAAIGGKAAELTSTGQFSLWSTDPVFSAIVAVQAACDAESL